MPIYLLIAGAAAVALYFATRTSTPAAGSTQALAGPQGGSVPQGDAVGVKPPPTGPQAMVREDKIGLMMMLPGTDIANVSSDKLGDVGVLMTEGVSPPSSGAPGAPATDVLKNANMAGHAILAKKGAPVGAAQNPVIYFMVSAIGTESATAAPGSDWFIFLQPKEFDAISKLAGNDTAAPDAGGGGGMGFGMGGMGGRGDMRMVSDGKSGAGAKPAFIPIFGNPFRKLAVGAPTVAAKDPTPDNAHLDWTALPEPLRTNVRASVDSGDWHSVIARADSARDGGFTVAAQQLYDMARTEGWAPSGTDHPDQMTFLEMIGDYSHPMLRYQAEVNRWTVDGIRTPPGTVIVPDGWVEWVKAFYNRVLSAPTAADEVDLRNNASMVGSAGYTKAAAELTALANAIKPSKPRFGGG